MRALREQFEAIAPGEESIAVARDMWESWQQSGVTPPDLDTIAAEFMRHENGFFYEIVRLAEKSGSKKLNIHFCQFSLDRYNAYAFTAKDGYIVLIDDVFFQILFFLCNIIVFDAMGLVTDDVERKDLKDFTDRIIHTNYINRQRIDFGEEKYLHSLMKKEYELTEFANYLFGAFKAFIIAHEIGHHILEHTSGKVTRIFSARNNMVEAEVDLRAMEMEYEADAWGYQLFHLLNHTTDNTVYYAYCKYKLLFAPALLFCIFDRLDRIQELNEQITIPYTDHPHPLLRYETIVNLSGTDTADDLYGRLYKSVCFYL
ncbi:MAG: hypothetical protein NTW29_17045 [Bacteroidetes bacterium]|nr:hypothetical protein [Bacteroidota bacterium]